MLGGPEIVIGLVGALGSDLKTVAGELEAELRSASYIPHLIRLTDLLVELPPYKVHQDLRGGPEDKRIGTLMTAGDDFRRSARRGDAMVLLGILEIQEIRKKVGGDPYVSLQRHAYILHSLKHPDEVATLRAIYASAFILISAYSPQSSRRDVLAARIARSRRGYDPDPHQDVAATLITRDEKDVADEFGQNVRDTFPLADFFLDVSRSDLVSQAIKRFVRILFGHPNSTPTVDEYGMFHAKAAALRSADLSRQVGAVVTTCDGEIISAGCNEVPKARGGCVWEGSPSDLGDYRGLSNWI